MTKARIHYARVDEFWRKAEKHAFLDEKQHVGNIEWQEIQPDAKQTWLTEGLSSDFDSFISLGSKEAKAASSAKAKIIFKSYSLGVSTNRDSVAYNFNKDALLGMVHRFYDDYNAEVNRYLQKGKPADIDNFLNYDKVQWSESLKAKLQRGRYASFDQFKTRSIIYRPFTKKLLYHDSLLIDRPGLSTEFFPTFSSEQENRLVAVCGHSQVPFSAQMLSNIPAMDVGGRPSQCLPFYTYDEDGTNRRENITDWALEEFRKHYGDPSINKWDIFHYVYAVLHHPVYRERYAANLKRELPRIPFAPDFHSFADAGKRLAEIHVNYESQPQYPLERIENPQAHLDWRVERMRLSKDKAVITYNDFLTLAGVPAECFEYRLGNRSALEWVIDQYQVSTDKRSGITNDPNRADDPQYIARLVGQIITVSLETVMIVRGLPALEVQTQGQ